MRYRLAALIALLALTAPAAAKRKRITVKMGTVAPEDTPWSKLAYRIRRYIHKRSNKVVKVKIYLSGILGDEKSMVRQCKAGSIQMIGVSTAAMAAEVPELQLLELPYLFRSAKEADYVLDQLFDDFAEVLRKRGFVLAYWSQNGWRGFGVKGDEPILKPADLKGRKMRSQESEVHVMMYKALGAKPKAIPVTKVLEDLKNDLVVGFDNTPLFTFATSWYQGIKHYTVSRHIFQPAVLVYSLKWWKAAKKEFNVNEETMYRVLAPRRKKLTRWGRRMIRRLDKPLLANFVAAGIKVHRLSKKMRRRFRKLTRKVHRRFVNRLGEDGKRLYRKIRKKLKKYRSR